MLILLSPAKTLDYSPVDYNVYTEPRLLSKSEQLVTVLQKKKVKDLKKLMSISDAIAEVNAERFASYKVPFMPGACKQALLAFKGDVYTGLGADDLNEDELDFAQKHLRILSGLYGLLRPLDLMHPYRLEMGTTLKVQKHKNLYSFWGEQITHLINDDLSAINGQYIINLASQEYFQAVHSDKLKGQLIHIHFKELRNGQLKVISFNAKKARGAMCRAILLEKILDPEDLKDLNILDYQYDESLSDDSNYFFIKR